MEEDSEQISEDELIIIKDLKNFKPSKEMILSYANILGYNPEEDPEETLDIAEKYLTIELPDNIIRAFKKEDYSILYMDKITKKIKLESDLEKKAKAEFEKLKKLLKNKKKLKNSYKNTEEELKKKKAQQKMYNNNNDEIIIKDIKKNNFIKKDINDIDLVLKEKKINIHPKINGNNKNKKIINLNLKEESCSSEDKNNLFYNKYSNDENNEDSYDKELDDKKNYLEKIRISLEKYKKKLKKNYITEEKDFIIHKIKSELNMDDIDIYELSLKQKMEQEINKFKKNLISCHEKQELNQSLNIYEIDLKHELDKKKIQLESEIRIQKERNKNKKIKAIKSNQKYLEHKKKILEKNFNDKKELLTIKNNNKIYELERGYKNNFENYKIQYEINAIKIEENINNNFSNDLYKFNINELEEEIIKELTAKFEEEKINIKNEFELNMYKEIKKEKNKIEKDIKKINENLFNLEKESLDKINLIKNEIKIQKEEYNINNINYNINDIKNKIINCINEKIKQIVIYIRQNINYHKITNEPFNDSIEGKLMNQLNTNKTDLTKMKSLFDLCEKDYIEIIMKIKFISNFIFTMKKILIEKSTNNNDDLIVEELKKELNELKIKYKNNINTIYPFLKEIKEEKNNDNNIINKSKYDYSLNSQYNPNYNINKTQRQEKKVSISFSQDKTIKNPFKSSERENGSIFSRTSTSNNNSDISNSNLRLSDNTLSTFTKDMINLYNKIIIFINEESNNIEKEKQIFNGKENLNNNLRSLKNDGGLEEYRDTINFILSHEQRNSKNKKLEIKSKIYYFKKIKSIWEKDIYYIYNNTNIKNIKIILNDLVEEINKYKSFFISEKYSNDNIIINKYNNPFHVSKSNNRYKGNNIRNSSFDVKYI